MRLFRPFFFSALLYPGAIFRLKTAEKLLCLTFDDGPDPLSTMRLLDMLDRFAVKAVFFCTGIKAEKYPELINKIKARGHLIGNHGYTHLNGWIISTEKYVADVNEAAPFTSYRLFRPPFGYLRYSQYIKLRDTFKIVFWDVMPYDFDNLFETSRSLQILKKKIRPGSVIVLHDTSESNAINLIEDFILFAIEKGYRFDNSALSDSSLS